MAKGEAALMKKPNILIYMTDHQRGDTALPEHPALTPNVSRLAAEGVLFDNAWCPTPHCCPSRATFVTGLYPSRHGVWNNICNEMALSHGLRNGVRCWSEDLVQQGYRLAWSGKWHVSITESPKDRGWQELSVSGFRPYETGCWERYRQLAQEREKTERGEGEILRPGYGHYRMYGAVENSQVRDDEKVVDFALDALPKLAAGGEPWCVYVGVSGPHDPYFVHQRYLDKYDLEKVPLPKSYFEDVSQKPAIVQRMRKQLWGQLTEREIREGIRHFWAYCTFLDELFGRLLSALDATGQAEDTLVLYCSDHGDYCGEHGLFAKGIPCYRGAYHVPTVIRWPRAITSPGRRVNEFVSLADFGPTFVDVAGRQPDPALTGRSLVPFLKNDPPSDWRQEICTQCNGVELYYTQRSIATREWKYVFNGFDRDELYRLTDDPDEMVNLAEDRALDGTKRELLRRMWRFAHREDDVHAINSYITTGLAPYGPALAFS
jgi:arylsulfatase A-like enzyme